MRWTAWLLAGVLLACGKSERETPAASSGGNASAGGGQGGTSTAEAGDSDAGDPASPAGRGSATGGSSNGSAGTAGNRGGAPNGGDAGTLALAGSDTAGSSAAGAQSAGAGGAGGNAGTTDAGGAGEAGAPAVECGTYDACGCGCCGSTPMEASCYYPERAEGLDRIVADDQAVATNENCRNAGCSAGTRHVCCMTPEVDPSATYELSGYSSDASYLLVKRTGTDGRCTWLQTIYPRDPEPGSPLELPERRAFDRAWDEPCGNQETSLQRPSIGELGALVYTVAPYCFAFDFTLFFLSDSGEVDAVRFAAAEVQFPGHPNCE